MMQNQTPIKYTSFLFLGKGLGARAAYTGRIADTKLQLTAHRGRDLLQSSYGPTFMHLTPNMVALLQLIVGGTSRAG